MLLYRGSLLIMRYRSNYVEKYMCCIPCKCNGETCTPYVVVSQRILAHCQETRPVMEGRQKKEEWNGKDLHVRGRKGGTAKEG